jgi:hypothetical protein
MILKPELPEYPEPQKPVAIVLPPLPPKDGKSYTFDFDGTSLGDLILAFKEYVDRLPLDVKEYMIKEYNALYSIDHRPYHDFEIAYEDESLTLGFFLLNENYEDELKTYYTKKDQYEQEMKLYILRKDKWNKNRTDWIAYRESLQISPEERKIQIQNEMDRLQIEMEVLKNEQAK